MALPRFIVLQSNEKNEYLGYILEKGESADGYLSFFETQAVSPYVKFEVERPASARAAKGDLVHLRSCQNHKYWVRTKNRSITRNPKEENWITATADQTEEDQSKESCTLFKLISVDPVESMVRIMHVQSGCYLCLWRRLSSVVFGRCVLANYNVFDGNGRDIFTIIDWESLLILPKYVAFKGDNNHYLCLRWIEGHPYLKFATEDIGDSTVPCEIFVTHEGNVRIKPTCSEKFWRRSPNWIWADSDHGADTSNPPLDTLFRPVKIDDRTIALLNLGNNNFCKRLTIKGMTSCLNAAVPSITKDAQIIVEEPVMTREIYDVKYELDYSRVYDESVLVAARNCATNYGQESAHFDLKLSYTETRTATWKTTSSLNLGVKTTSFDIGLPLIFEGKVEISGEVQIGEDWGKTTATTGVFEVVHKAVVPPRTKVTVNPIATKGMCDVPFSFIQRDTLYNGETVITEVQGGTFTGSNYYNFDFDTKKEKLQ